MGSLGPLEIGLIVFAFILLFGARKLPELGSSVGKTITNFRKGLKDAEQDIAAEEAAESATTSEPATTSQPVDQS